MQKPTLYYIEQTTIKTLRNFILDKGLTESDSILLNQIDFDDLVLEYRSTYCEGLVVPFYLLRVQIRETSAGSMPSNRIGVIKDDVCRYKYDYDSQMAREPNDSYKYETVYRCGWCGNVVDFDGSEFDHSTRQFKIDILQKYETTITEKKVDGNCCPNGHY